MWSSSLTDSTLRAKPDNQSVDYASRISALSDMLDVTTKPIIFDADNGGRIEHIPFLVKSLEDQCFFYDYRRQSRLKKFLI